MYRQLVHEITQTFTKISQDIILITKQLEDDHNLTTIATIVTGIQNNEKDKLEKVCEAFAMKYSYRKCLLHIGNCHTIFKYVNKLNHIIILEMYERKINLHV